MSANDANTGGSSRTGIFPSVVPRKRTPLLGMEQLPSRFSPQSHFNETSAENSSRMSALALRPPVLSSSNAMMWDKRQLGTPTERIELPSIRQAVPEIQLRARQTEVEYRMENTSYSPTTGPRPLTSPEYVPSPPVNKRRKLSSEEGGEHELRDRTIPRRYRSPSRPFQRSQSVAHSPTSSAQQATTSSSAESWNGSSRNSPYIPPTSLPVMRSPAPFDTSSNRTDWRPTLPSLPTLTLDRAAGQAPRGHSGVHEYAFDSAQSSARTYPQMLTSAFDPPMSYQHPALPYGYQQTRGQSYSGPSIHPLSHDRTPFSNSHQNMYPGSGFSYNMSDSGSDSKQRKRRGNLPKETTDKLRSWFVAHLQHPYPTEDEKQDLMHQTGLQINQISNWFINARRRQLPAMINNARAESDARIAREGDGLVRGDSTSDYGDDKRGSVPLDGSEGEGSVYDDEFDSPRSQHGLQSRSKRESI